MAEGHPVRAMLLGSEGLAQSLPAALAGCGGDGPVAVISAGMQDREGALEILRNPLQRPIIDLRLYERAVNLFEADPELASAIRARNRRVHQIQRDYRIRLSHAVDAALSLDRASRRRKREQGFENRHLDDALAALRDLDARHFQYLQDVQVEPLPASDALRREQAAVHELLERCDTVLIAGGHVAVLRNRIRVFSLEAKLRDTNVVGWGAGAMALAERIVLFLDHSPRGPRQPEVLDAGIAAVRGTVVIPAARRRLALDTHPRMALTARRFSPSRCIGLGDNADVRFLGENMTHAHEAFALTADGGHAEVSVA